MDNKTIRRGNLELLIKRFDTLVALADASATNAANLSQIRNGTRQMGDDVARRIEAGLNKTLGWMDSPHFEAQEPPATYVNQKWPAVVGTAELGDDGFWMDIDYPPGHGDGFIGHPSRDPDAYALRCKGDSMRPRIKHGEFVIVEPNHAYVPGDEVVVKDKHGRVMVKVFNFSRNGSIEVGSVNEDHKSITLDMANILHIHYVAAICKPAMHHRDHT